MPRGGTSTLRRPALRVGVPAGSPGRLPLLAVAGAGAAVAAIAVGAAALWGVYVLVRVGGRVADGDAGGAVRWATMLFVAGAPLVVGYGAYALHERALARLRGAPRAIAVRALALPALVIAGALGLQGALSGHSYFVTDDWLHIAVAHDAATGSGLDMHYLGRIVFIHYAPGHRFAYWLLDRVAPLDFNAVLALMLALFAGSLAVFHRICVRLFGRRSSNLLLLALFGTSVLIVPSFLWVADGIHKFPSMFLSLLAIDAYLTYHFEGRRRALAVAVGAVALGSLFYAKALLVPLYLMLLRGLFLERDPRNALRVLVRCRWTWLAFAPALGIYLLNHVLTYAGEGIPPPSLHLLGKYLWLAWFRGVTPAFVGVHVGIDAGYPELLMGFGAQALLIAVIVVSIRRKRSAWRAWVFWAVAFAANATIVGLGRLGSLGLKQVGSQLRYDTEMIWLLPLALGFAFFPGDVAGRDTGATGKPWRWLGHRRLRIGIVALALCAYLAATIDTSRDTAQAWREQASDQSKTWATNLQHDAARLKRPEVIDDQTPPFLIGAHHKPWNRLERLAPAVAPSVRVVPAAADPFEIHQNGQITPAQVQALATGPHAIPDAGAVRLQGGVAWRRAGWPCVSTPRGPAAISFSTQRFFRGQSLFAKLRFDVRRPVSRPAVITGNTYRGGEVPLPLDARHGRAVLNLGHQLRVVLPRGTSVCLTYSGVGWISP